MKIGDKFTNEQFQEVKKQYRVRSFGVDWWLLNKDLRFEKSVDSDIIVWELVSTFDSRVADQDNGHANVHRKEQKYTKSYYETKN
mgnify:CR=1 FL=1